ncbi:glycosyltransferase family 2 protein [Cellulomonas alba]|uniref:Glycosyltransferase family 2 protein n=1 Tax=Cellulomonas alba TaxID=3053467 RepID=A0ABT7SHF9_9CELL|nr:glycosyltransferase family 2 protein [Cellulomonas alba]MDM7854969.1 glycosyltransferase family 2 protein [Cellulomonas alba]
MGPHGEAVAAPAPYRRTRRLGWAWGGLAATAVVLLGAGAALVTTDWFDGIVTHETIRLTLGGLVTIDLPSGAVLLAAVLLSASLAVAVAAAELGRAQQALAAKANRPGPPGAPVRAGERPGAPVAGRGTRGPTAAAHITALIPAHDEATTIGATIDSLRAQRRPPDAIVVVTDRCTDATEDIAADRGARVLITRGNTGRKAGALNQALAELLPSAREEDAILVMDADTVLAPDFLAVAESRLEADPDLQAVGGVFMGDPGAGLVGQLQRNEYVRYARTIARRKGRRVTVLTGTGSLFRAPALRAVAASRGSSVPGTPGDVYDASALTEDNELTLALRTLGARLVSPRECRAVTEVMPTWRHLWRQRVRWDRGALENLGAYGLTLSSARYWWQQIGLAYATVAVNLYVLLVLLTWLATGTLVLGLRWWTAITVIFVVERLVTVWRAGWRGRLLALPLAVELAYSELILVVFVRGLVDAVLRRQAVWGHVDRASLSGTAAVAAPVGALAVLGEPVVSWAAAGSTGWIATLSAVVAFNTVVFAALALLELVPRRQA